jgi:hypothetical protein
VAGTGIKLSVKENGYYHVHGSMEEWYALVLDIISSEDTLSENVFLYTKINFT